MTRFFAVALFLLVPIGAAHAGIEWRDLPAMPEGTGMGGAFAGEIDGTLLVAGGAHFPSGMPWDGGPRVVETSVLALDPGAEEWRPAGTLPAPRGYGVSIQGHQGLLLIGGSDADGVFDDCWLVTLVDGQAVVDEFPSLPTPLASMAGARIGHIVHVVGGITDPAATTAENRHFLLDLNNPAGGWTEGPPLPGPGRLLPVAGARDGALYVFSGAALSAGEDGGPVREYLSDAWRYRPATGWEQLEDTLFPAVAAPTPAPAVGASHLLVIGGDDGSLVGFQPRTAHPGFPGRLQAFNTITGRWSDAGQLPENMTVPVTATLVESGREWIIPTGEARPGVRTTQVIAGSPVSERPGFGAVNWTVVAVYLAGMVGIGVWFMKREAASSTEAYFRGNQSVPAWVAGLSVFATMLSALTFMGIPARVYQTDSSWYIGQLAILLVVPLVIACYLPFFRKLDLTSAYEYLERRFNLPCRLFASLSFTFFHLGRIAIVLYLPALALAAVSDIQVDAAILIIGVLCVIYTVIGGIKAVVWTDAVQAIVLMAGALLCLALAAWRIDGGASEIAAVAARDAKGLSNLEWGSLSIADGTQSVVILFIALFFNSLVPYTSSQDVVQRYMTTRDIAAAKRSLKLTMWMSVFGSMVFFVLGIAVYAYYTAHPAELDPTLPAVDSILPFYILQQLPIGISGLVIAAIFAASQSTISSSLNSVSTVFVKDIDARLLRPGRDDKTYLWSARIVVVLVGIFGIATALWMAHSTIESAFKTFNTLIGLTAGSLGGLFALGIFVRRANGTGAFVGAVAALAMVIALRASGAPVTGLLYAAIGFTACLVLGLVLSFILPGRTDPSLSYSRQK